MNAFHGFHSEWNLGSPGGWDYQRTNQEISKAVWERINRIKSIGINLDFDHPLLYPVVGFADMLIAVHRQREGDNPGIIAVTAEEETLADVTENINLANRLDQIDGISGILAAPYEFEIQNGRVCHQGRPVSLIFMDFNNDVLLRLHRKYNLAPLLQAVSENRVLNPRGTEPINVKSMFEVFTGPLSHRFHRETVERTPWTRRFFDRETTGPAGEPIPDLLEWTRKNWGELVLKPARGYSGKGVHVGGVHKDADAAIQFALSESNFILQEKIPLPLWGEDIPEIDTSRREVGLVRRQTDFRCLIGPDRLFGFLGRFGDVPTNVGSGGGVQPLAFLKADMSVRDAVQKINESILSMDYNTLLEIEEMQKTMAREEKFTYLLGPIKIALRPRVITLNQLDALKSYCRAMWADCLTLEKMWRAGELDEYIDIEEQELEIARRQPWEGGPAIFASDGLFSFGAHPEA